MSTSDEYQSNRGNGLRKSGDRSDDMPKRIDSRLLLGKEGKVFIVHEGEEYRLSVTRNGKLILTK